MKSLFKIAWRNCWRGRTRTLIVVSSISIGIWGSLLFMGFMDGLMSQRLTGAINSTYSHLQIQSETYGFDQDIGNSISDADALRMILEEDTQIVAYTDRFETEALVQTAREQRGTKLIGVDWEKEAQTVSIHQKLIEGEYFGDQYKRPIVIGKKMAEELKVKIGSKIIVTFTNIDSVQSANNYRVSGIFQSGNTAFDEYHVFVPKESVYVLTGEPIIHQILVKTNNAELVEQKKLTLQESLTGNVKVLTWRDSDPTLAYGEDMYNSMLAIIMIIIIVGLLFGIINTIVMSILERKREIGVLVAIGMNHYKIKLMIASESMFYGLIGGPIGVLLGYLSILYFNVNGLDLSAYADGMMEYGLDPIIYFDLPTRYYFIYGGLITFAAFLGGLYPARMATKMNPIDAIRSI